ncbi:apoptosis inhibitory protein 5-domain-containing protein [Dipodascopsis uninucleata]
MSTPNQAPEGNDPVQQIYYYYEVAKGLTGASIDETSAAYSKILKFSSPSADKKARTLANSFIPDLFSLFATNKDLASKAIESMIDFCEDEDAKVRMETIKRLPDLAVKTQKSSDKELVLDILIQLLQTQTPAELQIVKNSLERAMKELPEVGSKQLWNIVSSKNEPVLQQVALGWISANGKQVLGSSVDFAIGGIKAVGNIDDIFILNSILPILLTLPSLKGGEDAESKKLLTDLLDSLISKAPVESNISDSNEQAKEYISFLPRWVVNILSRNASTSSLLKYLSSSALPAMLNGKISGHKEQTHILRLVVEGCASRDPSPEIDIVIPKLKDAVIKLSKQIDSEKNSSQDPEKYNCDWALIEPAVVALYIACRRAPSYPISTDASQDLTPALKNIYFLAQVASPNHRRRLSQLIVDTEEYNKLDKTRLQCQNATEVIREMLKLPALRSKVPPPVKFSWRPHAPTPTQSKTNTIVKAKKKRAVSVQQAGGASPQSSTGQMKDKVRLKRRANELDSKEGSGSQEKKSRIGTNGEIAKPPIRGRKRGGGTTATVGGRKKN